ncbi:ROK family protein [Aquirufa ecclesiirivi]|uniref:ROK family protein n=1 Tax=Aquirufa ecclesiirivi TaxID=2715124 RepID=UPI0023D80634|nr:ROK family protein [Aquirufa ecclesiirivi]MDF0692988.1 ROK family protein [Aquirufa ecclesiirivi]
MEAAEYLGIDVGGTGVKMGIVHPETGHITNFQSYDTATWRESNHFLERLADAIALQLFQHKHVNKVGIGLPGILTKNRKTLIEITAIPEIDGAHLISMLEKRFPEHEFFMENDANAAALGEFYFSPEKESMPEDFIFLTLGTGIGGAAIIDRKIFLGGDGNAMEPGHVPSRNGKVLERNIGKKELLQMATAMRAAYKGKTVLEADGSISTTALVVAAEEGDELALAIWNEVGEMLGDMIVSLIRILDIKNIFIGGGLSASFDFILPSMEKQLNYWLTPAYLKKLSIKKALLGNDAGLLGAASLCF